MTDVSTAERRARLARRHHLHPASRAETLDDATAGVVALHATDPASIHLGLLARVREVRLVDVDRALYDDRSLVRVMAMRRTIFVARAEDAPVLFAACSRRVAAAERSKLVRQLAATSDLVDPASWLESTLTDAIEALADLGPCLANDLTRAVPALQTRWNPAPRSKWGGETPVGSRILSQLAMEGLAERTRPAGGPLSTRYRWQVADPPLPELAAELDEDEARAVLLGRWLERFGPGTEADLVWWSGLPKGAVRRAIADLGAEAVDLDGAAGWRLPGDADDATHPGPWVALLPGLDPTAMGWRDRGWYLDPALVPEVFDTVGNAGPTVWADGRVVGGWAHRPGGEVAVELLLPLGDDHRDLLEIERARVQAFLADAPSPLRHRFPTPVEKRLAAPG